MVEVARHEEQRSPRAIEYILGHAAEERVFGNFDIATAVFLFNYADDARTLEKMFSNVAANLKPDGELVAVVPNPDFVNGRGDTIQYGFKLEVIEKRPANLHQGVRGDATRRHQCHAAASLRDARLGAYRSGALTVGIT